MIIDSHAHLKHGDAAHTEYTAEEVVRVMDAAGIERSVVFAMCTTTRDSIARAEAAVSRFPDRLIPYAYALPSYERPVLDELRDAIAGRGFRGVKVHVGECTFAEYVTDPVLALAGELGVPCLMDYGGRSADLERQATTFPDTTLIVAHFGQYKCTAPATLDTFIDLAAAHENIVLDTSGVVLPWKIKQAADRIGADRVVWGTDGPYTFPDEVTFAQDEIAKIQTLDLTDEQTSDILGGAISRLLSV